MAKKLFKKNDWLEEFSTKQEFKEKILKTLEISGFPLEFRVLNLFPGNYSVSHSYFDDKNDEGKTITREIDVLAKRNYEIIESFMPNFQILLQCLIVVECKSTMNRDLLVFEILEKDEGNTIINFPITINGKHIAELSHNTLTGLKKDFEFKYFSAKVTDITVTKDGIFRYRGGESFENFDQDKQKLFIESNKVLKAVNYYFNRDISRVYGISNDFFKQYKDEWERYRLTNPSENGRNFVKQISKSKKLPMGVLELFFYFPVLVLNNETQIVLAKLDKSKKPELQGFEVCNHLIYLHSPENINSFRFFDNLWSQAILITNEKNLKENIEKIEKWIKQQITDISELTKKQPDRFIPEVLGHWASWSDPHL